MRKPYSGEPCPTGIKPPRFIEPLNIDDAVKRVIAFAASFHEHAYLLGKTLQWCYARFPKKVTNHCSGFAQFVHTNFWFTVQTAHRMMKYARLCDEAGELVDYIRSGANFHVFQRAHIIQQEVVPQSYTVQEYFPEAWTMGDDEQLLGFCNFDPRREVALRQILKRLSPEEKRLIWVGIFLGTMKVSIASGKKVA